MENFQRLSLAIFYLVIHLLGLAVVLALITFGSIKLKYRIVGEIFGLLATLIEIILAFPQIIKCFQ